MPKRIEICHICKELRPIKKRENILDMCNKCYKKFYYKKPKFICSNCGKIDVVKKRTIIGDPICPKCSKESCSICGKLDYVAYRILTKPVCRKCHKEECSICNMIKPVKQRDKFENAICFSCYKVPEKKCIKCGKLKPVCKRDSFNNPICKNCNKSICMVCNEIKISYKIINDKHICVNCYIKIKKQKDVIFNITILLRARLKGALDRYTKTGKIQSSSKYGINYKKIIDHLYPFPENISDYHIDHIFPLSAFDLNDPLHIKAAFAPENHQWLKKEENLSKNAKYNKEDFEIYLKKHIDILENKSNEK